MGLTAKIADFIVALNIDTLPPEVVEKARVCILNGYGIAIGCHNTPYAPVARQAALAMDGERTDGATLLGDGRKTSVTGAALANSALFHGRAQEDTCGAAHLGAVMIPLLTALIEARSLSTERFLPALIAGYETGGLLEKNYSSKTTPGGFRASTLYGVVAAAAAVSKLLEFDADQTAAAIANAASFSGGILQSFADGTDEWRYQVGMVGRTGLVAAELARAGSVSAPGALEGPSGLIKSFAREDGNADELAAQLGHDWATLRVTFKPYPVCAFNQTPVIAALALREELAGAPIRAVRVRMNPYETGYAGMDSKGPFHSISGTLMSIPFCIANTLLHGSPSMQAMTTYADPAVNAMIPNIDLISDDNVATLCCTIEIDCEDGRSLLREQVMTFADFSYERAEVSRLIRRVGGETNVSPTAYDHLEAFVDSLPNGDIQQVWAAFSAIE
ncbi:MAG: MmgE/PrpD family protein 4 [Gammaproteobacteria bacterium]|nr:MAG: MmgE/PrpD family protein 4 [Gammaproteobacteria bacterium]RLA61693.1 MAG: MmgE/PrpD family protein 4 [Gammaproteobacteria bacterium]